MIDITALDDPLVDITALNAVESLFRDGPSDPWGQQLAGQLTDLFIYSDRIRYVQPVGERGSDGGTTRRPPSSYKGAE